MRVLRIPQSVLAQWIPGRWCPAESEVRRAGMCALAVLLALSLNIPIYAEGNEAPVEAVVSEVVGSGTSPVGAELGRQPPSRRRRKACNGSRFEPIDAFPGVQHGFRFATEEGTREGMRGPFLNGWYQSLSALHGWSDGDPFYVNYVGHPLQGAVAQGICFRRTIRSIGRLNLGTTGLLEVAVACGGVFVRV